MVTSPPYDVGKQYDENLSLNEYRAFFKLVWSEVKRVIVPGGRVCINIANLGRKPYIPLHAYIVEDVLDLTKKGRKKKDEKRDSDRLVLKKEYDEGA